MNSNSTPCMHCGEVWIHFDESVRYSSSGKCIPLDEKNERHDFRDCPKSAYNLRKESKVKARAYKKTELKKIEDYALLAEIHDKVRHWNSRLVNYTLDLEVIPKKQLIEGEEI
jgi:hypothetical protein